MRNRHSSMGYTAQSLAMLLFVATLGCDPRIQVRGDITIPASVQARFSAQSPGRLYVTAFTTAAATPEIYDGLRILCDPGVGDLVVPVMVSRSGCATEMRFAAKVSVVSQSPEPCGTTGHGPGHADSEVLVAEASQIIFQGTTSCTDSIATVHLTVAEPTTAP